MERLLTLSKIDNLEKAKQSGAEGIIFGSLFSTRFKYNLKEFVNINKYCLANNIKRYINIDAFINESELNDLTNYLLIIKKIRPDGIYFTDLGIINIAKNLNIKSQLIYDPDTLLTNSLDILFYLKQDIDVVVARELELKELLNIVKRNKNKLDLQVFGHLKMSNSRREFLSNYFKYLNKEEDIKNKKTIRLIEETRNYELPIIEDEFGTRIYSDYIFIMYRELAYIKDYLKRVIIDDNFIEGDIAFDVVKDIKRLNVDNSEYLLDTLKEKYAYLKLDSLYLYQKSTKKKDE